MKHRHAWHYFGPRIRPSGRQRRLCDCGVCQIPFGLFFYRVPRNQGERLVAPLAIRPVVPFTDQEIDDMNYLIQDAQSLDPGDTSPGAHARRRLARLYAVVLVHKARAAIAVRALETVQDLNPSWELPGDHPLNISILRRTVDTALERIRRFGTTPQPQETSRDREPRRD